MCLWSAFEGQRWELELPQQVPECEGPVMSHGFLQMKGCAAILGGRMMQWLLSQIGEQDERIKALLNDLLLFQMCNSLKILLVFFICHLSIPIPESIRLKTGH